MGEHAPAGKVIASDVCETDRLHNPAIRVRVPSAGAAGRAYLSMRLLAG